MCALYNTVFDRIIYLLQIPIWTTIGFFVLSTIFTAISVWITNKKNLERQTKSLRINFYASFSLLLVAFLYVVLFVIAIICTPFSSFHGDTQIWTPDGPRMIRDLQAGDAVYSYNNMTASTESEQVQFIQSYPAFRYYILNNSE